MNSVKIKTSDSKIWDKDTVLWDLLRAVNQGPVSIDLLHEGPCCNTSGIDDIINSALTYTKQPSSLITIKTSNQLPSSMFKEVRKGLVELDLAKKILANKKNIPSTLNKIFGIFIGRSNWIRLGLASYLYVNYKDTVNMTFHYDCKDDFFKDNFGLEELVSKNWNQCNEVFNFLPCLPIKHNYQTYPILWNRAAFDLDDQYRDIFCEIICETYFTGNVFFFTEKLMRCIQNRRPFIVQGPQYFLKNLKKLGFRTFDRWWDEGYSNDCTDAMFVSIKQNIDWIASQSRHTIETWYKEMQPVLENNVTVLSNLTNERITHTKFDHE